jgi:enterochelin esterase-like enzyme
MPDTQSGGGREAVRVGDFFSSVWAAVLHVDMLSGPAPLVVYVAAASGVVAVLLWRFDRRWLVTAALAALAGALIAVGLWLVCVRWLDLFGGSLGVPTYAWLAAALAGLSVAAVSVFRRGGLRRTVSALTVVAVALAGVFAINAEFGINRTVGGMLNVVVDRPIRLTPPSTDATKGPTEASPLWQSWRPPADMPAAGKTGTASIPDSASGFAARPAGIYLPPAALVPDPPRLPVVLMLMGQPGTPDPGPIGRVLDAFAAKNHGLAPIVVVADQTGVKVADTGCVDSAAYGRSRTYLLEDVIPWMRTHLNVLPDPRFWTVAGYSNGGQCAISLGAEHPELFRTIISVSGEEYPGASNPARALATLFGGDRGRLEREKPVTLLSARQFPTSTAVFTAAKDDPRYLAVARKLAIAARGAGMNTQLRELDHGGHGIGALLDGLTDGFAVAYPVLGLSRPGSEASAGGLSG